MHGLLGGPAGDAEAAGELGGALRVQEREHLALRDTQRLLGGRQAVVEPALGSGQSRRHVPCRTT
ncbi:hypothetical protein ACFW4M_02875 [Streptomyces sp. NPDC058794]|uniref:hypothetical protein n=1 Tax=unclassified Streptomyces TaxID=2593676 RepID=UPI0036914F83